MFTSPLWPPIGRYRQTEIVTDTFRPNPYRHSCHVNHDPCGGGSARFIRANDMRNTIPPTHVFSVSINSVSLSLASSRLSGTSDATVRYSLSAIVIPVSESMASYENT